MSKTKMYKIQVDVGLPKEDIPVEVEGVCLLHQYCLNREYKLPRFTVTSIVDAQCNASLKVSDWMTDSGWRSEWTILADCVIDVFWLTDRI